MHNERSQLHDAVSASVIRGAAMIEGGRILGYYHAWVIRDGKLLWEDVFPNVVTDVGANHILDNYLNTGAFTQTGPFMGLISADGYTSAPAVGNTMASHAGWYEAGASHGPQWTGSNARPTCNGSFNAAGSRIKALSAAKAFTINGVTNGATVKGAFMVCGSGAVTTNGDTNGTLLSAGLFTGGDKGPLAANDVLNVSWQLQLT